MTLEAWNARMHQYSFNFIGKFKQLHCPVPLFIASIEPNPSSKEKSANIGVILDQDKNIGPILLLLGSKA
jgi:hypothetical protein